MALAGLATWQGRLRWAGPALLGFLLTMLLLFPLNQLVRTGVAEERLLFTPIAGWSAPVLILEYSRAEEGFALSLGPIPVLVVSALVALVVVIPMRTRRGPADGGECLSRWR